MVVSANDVGYLHQRIVNDDGIVIRWPSIRSQKDGIADTVTVEFDGSVHNVVEANRTSANTQPDDSGFLRLKSSIDFIRWQRSARAGVLSIGLRFQLFFGTEAPEGMSCLDQPQR